MTALANVALTNTLDEWRIRTNQIIVKLDQVESNSIVSVVSNTSTINVATSIYGNTVYLNSNAFPRTGGTITGEVYLSGNLTSKSVRFDSSENAILVSNVANSLNSQYISFRVNSAPVWALGRSNTGKFFLYDATTGQDVFNVTSNSNVTFSSAVTVANNLTITGSLFGGLPGGNLGNIMVDTITSGTRRALLLKASANTNPQEIVWAGPLNDLWGMGKNNTNKFYLYDNMVGRDIFSTTSGADIQFNVTTTIANNMSVSGNVTVTGVIDLL